MFAAIGLHNPKSTVNVGSALRIAAGFEAVFVATTGRRYHGSPTDTGNFVSQIPLIQVEDLHTIIPYNYVPVAVECGLSYSVPLHTFVHPFRAFYVFGPEDGSLGKSVVDWCRDVVHIDTKNCMNLAAAVSVVLYDRSLKFEVGSVSHNGYGLGVS